MTPPPPEAMPPLRADDETSRTGSIGKPASPTAAPAKEAARAASSTFAPALKSSALIGGASLINVVLTVLRTKVLSMLVGPAGLGLMGMYNSIIAMGVTVAGLGINSSGVRQIAHANGSGDEARLALTVATLRRTALMLGLAGTLALILFSGPVCRLAFGETSHQGAIVLLAAAVFFTVVQGAQAALLQGLRRIRDSAKLNILAGVFATLFSVPMVYFLGINGIAPFLVAAALAGLIASWWYTRHVPSLRSPGMAEMRSEAGALMRLGSAVLLSAAIGTVSALLLRTLIVRQGGLVGVGIYQAGSGIAVLYVNFILQAMGMDFYPRLTAASDAGGERTRLVNEQAEISLLFALPGVLGTMVLAPLAIRAFYSPAFLAAVMILKWHLLGMLFRVVAFPLSYLTLALGDALTFSVLEIVFGTLQVFLVWMGLRVWGLDGAGIGFFVLNLLYLPTLSAVAGKRYGFRWSHDNLGLWSVMAAAVAVTWAAGFLRSGGAGLALGLTVVLLTGVFCLRRLHWRLGSPPLGQMLTAIRQRSLPRTRPS